MNDSTVNPQANDELSDVAMTLDEIVRERFASNVGFVQELELVARALQLDDGYAWSWQCNLAMAIHDEGVERMVANRAAARFMQAAFQVDITKNPNWASLVAQFEETKASQTEGVSISANAIDAMTRIWNNSTVLQFVLSDMGRMMSVLVAGNIADNKATFYGLGVKFRKDKNVSLFDESAFKFEHAIQWTYDLAVEGSKNIPGVTALVHALHYLEHESQVDEPTAPYLKTVIFKLNKDSNLLDVTYTYGLQKELGPDESLLIPKPRSEIVAWAVPVDTSTTND